MALQTKAVARQWLSSDHMGTPKYMNATMAQQHRNGIFCAVHANRLQVWQVSGVQESRAEEWAVDKEWFSESVRTGEKNEQWTISAQSYRVSYM
jgi:hypothetical protein